MAAIDRMYLSNYNDKYILMKWIERHRPSLLQNVFYPTMTEAKWDNEKQEIYNSHLKINEKEYKKHGGNKYRIVLNYAKCGYECPLEQAEEEAESYKRQREELEDEIWYKFSYKLPVACFSCETDTWLKWHCPLDFVREYLKAQCGMKEHWYYKLFFLY